MTESRNRTDNPAPVRQMRERDRFSWQRLSATLIAGWALAATPAIAFAQVQPASAATTSASPASALAPPAPASSAPARKSSLPEAALIKAREAERQLAANAPEKAIEILRELDKQYPNKSALSLRLAQINDTLGRNGYALFYYRRYVAQAGPRARTLAVERVSSLELMAGVNTQLEKVEKEFGVETRPIATPAAHVERMLATKAKDGSLVPIRNEKDLEKLEREGVPDKSPVTPVPTSATNPIVLPDMRAAKTPAATPPAAAAGVPASAPGTLTQVSDATQPSPAPASAQTKKHDEDALLAQAFRRSDDPNSDDKNPRELKVTAADLAPSVAGDLTQKSNATPAANADPDANNAAQLPQRAVVPPNVAVAPAPAPARQPSPSPAAVAFIQPTPAFASARAAAFFNISAAPGQYALVSLLNEVPSSVATVSITPRDDGEVISAILASKEQKRLYLRPGTYDVTANVSTTDYSPITLMNTNFAYTFAAGQQYTRRFNKINVQQLN